MNINSVLHSIRFTATLDIAPRIAVKKNTGAIAEFILLCVCVDMYVFIYFYLLWAVKVTSVEKGLSELGHTACFYWNFPSTPAPIALSIMDYVWLWRRDQLHIIKSTDNQSYYIHLIYWCCCTVYCTNCADVKILCTLVISTDQINGMSSPYLPLRRIGELKYISMNS